MKTRNLQSGFGAIAAVFLVLVVAVIGFAGYKVFTMDKGSNAPVATATPVNNMAAPSAIKSKADLAKAAQALDNTSSTVDSTLNDNALNQDLSDML